MYSFIETKLFTRLSSELLSDEEMRELQMALIADPQAGDVVPGLDADDLSEERSRKHAGAHPAPDPQGD